MKWIKRFRNSFAALTIVFAVLAAVDAHINHRDNLFNGPFLFPELTCSAVSIVFSIGLADAKKEEKEKCARLEAKEQP